MNLHANNKEEKILLSKILLQKRKESNHQRKIPRKNHPQRYKRILTYRTEKTSPQKTEVKKLKTN